jgi:hypothetical protein
VTVEGREVDKNSVLLEGWHPVADDFPGMWCGFADNLTYSLKYGLHFRREAFDVLVNAHW